MNIRDAILKAADHLEANPQLWDFCSSTVPDCGTPGCAAGWIGHFRGVPAGRCLAIGFANNMERWLVEKNSPMYYKIFSERMSAIDSQWPWSVKTAVKTMRKYADKYHPAEVTTNHTDFIPATVRQLFEKVAA